jgi:Lrp/AsnC family leucine-responsive transcriptional regulator
MIDPSGRNAIDQGNFMPDANVSTVYIGGAPACCGQAAGVKAPPAMDNARNNEDITRICIPTLPNSRAERYSGFGGNFCRILRYLVKNFPFGNAHANETDVQVKLDAIDKRMLAVLQKDCQASLSDLAEHAGISASAAQRRLKTLRESGVIRKEVAVIAPEAVGRPLLFIVQIEVQDETDAQSRTFWEKLAAAPEVMQCFYVTGSADYILLCSAKSMDDYEEFTARMFAGNPCVSKFKTSVVMKTVKHGFEVPLD